MWTVCWSTSKDAVPSMKEEKTWQTRQQNQFKWLMSRNSFRFPYLFSCQSPFHSEFPSFSFHVQFHFDVMKSFSSNFTKRFFSFFSSLFFNSSFLFFVQFNKNVKAFFWFYGNNLFLSKFWRKNAIQFD